MLRSLRSRAVLAAVVTLVTSLLLAVVPVGTASAATTETVTGVINFPAKRAKVEVVWFTSNWQYLGRKNAGAGSYALNLAPGTYWLQFLDQRASYDIGKYAPTDVKVKVRAGEPTIRNVTMQRGGYITGTVRGGDGKPAAKATVTAANTQGRSYSTTANGKGQFAIGGLPQSKYSVFTWDKKKRWVGKSAWAGKVKPRQGKDLRIRLGKRAGALRVLLYTPQGSLKTKTQVTVTSKKTGQWWTANASGGSAVFKGLYPGKYTLDFPGAGIWLRATKKPVQSATVKSGKTVIGKVKVTQRGGWITGQIVDGSQPSSPLGPPWVNGPGATVALYDAHGTKLATTKTATNGTFTLSGLLTTQSGLTVVVDPPSEGGGYMDGAARCRFDRQDFEGYSIKTGRETKLGSLALPRTPAQEGQCAA